MNWLDKLERRFGFVAIPRLLQFIIGLQLLTMLLSVQEPQLPEMLVLDPRAVVAGQWWRLASYVLVPKTGPINFFFALLWFPFFWMMGQSLEAEWGAFRMTLYLLLGIFCGAFISMAGTLFLDLPIFQNGFYWALSIQLAFAYLYPEVEILIYFILPVKMRWLAWFSAAFMLFQIATQGFPAFFKIAGSLANYILFFAPLAWRQYRSQLSSQAAQAVMQSSMREAVASLPAKACKKCGKGVDKADLRLCLCDRCGEDGNFWCVEDLKEHLKN